MKRAAIVMGFGLECANDDIAKAVADGCKEKPFDIIFSQAAVVPALLKHKLQSVPMHGHHDGVYVDTIDAAGFALFQLKDFITGDEVIAVEVFAHSLQLKRAHRTVVLAQNCLLQRPLANAFLKQVEVRAAHTQVKMRLNKKWSWAQFWTCYLKIGPCKLPLYPIFSPLIGLRTHARRLAYASREETFYKHLTEILEKLRDKGVDWSCSAFQNSCSFCCGTGMRDDCQDCDGSGLVGDEHSSYHSCRKCQSTFGKVEPYKCAYCSGRGWRPVNLKKRSWLTRMLSV